MDIAGTIYLVLALLLLFCAIGVVAPALYSVRMALLGSIPFVAVMIAIPQMILLGLLVTALTAWYGGLGHVAGQLGLVLHVAAWSLLLLHLWQLRTTYPLLDGRPIGDATPIWGHPPLPSQDVSFWPYLTRRTRVMPHVRVRRSVVYREVAGVRLVLDVYAPRQAAPAGHVRPSVIYVHGGGWVGGTRRQSPFMMYELAAAGYVVFAIEYRLAPRHPLPAAIVDCKAAVAWVRRHAAEYGASPAPFVIGGSAGGHLAAMMALSPNERAYQPGFEDVDTRVRGAVLFYGLYDLVSRVDAHAKPSLRGFFEKLIFDARYQEDPDLFHRAQPLTHVDASAPPILIVHGQHDTLVPIEDSRLLHDRLAAAGARVHLCEVPRAQHAFEITPSPLHIRTMRIVRGFLADIGGV